VRRYKVHVSTPYVFRFVFGALQTILMSLKQSLPLAFPTQKFLSIILALCMFFLLTQRELKSVEEFHFKYPIQNLMQTI
jgi:hypothetical protein